MESPWVNEDDLKTLREIMPNEKETKLRRVKSVLTEMGIIGHGKGRVKKYTVESVKRALEREGSFVVEGQKRYKTIGEIVKLKNCENFRVSKYIKENRILPGFTVRSKTRLYDVNEINIEE